MNRLARMALVTGGAVFFAGLVVIETVADAARRIRLI